MGTNYYAYKQEHVCPTCNRELGQSVYHIGKQSYGWKFHIHIEPKFGINNLEDVYSLFETHQIIKDENGNEISIDEIKKKIESKDEHKFITPRSEYYKLLKWYGGDGDVYILTDDDCGYDMQSGEFL